MNTDFDDPNCHMAVGTKLLKLYSILSFQISVMLECPDGRQPTALVGFGVISLKEGCTITSREFHYPHTFRGIVEISISSGAFNKEVTIGLEG